MPFIVNLGKANLPKEYALLRSKGFNSGKFGLVAGDFVRWERLRLSSSVSRVDEYTRANLSNWAAMSWETVNAVRSQPGERVLRFSLAEYKLRGESLSSDS